MNLVKNILSVIVILILVQGLVIAGDRITETRLVKDFNSVHLTGSGYLTIIQGNDESLTIEADKKILPYLKSEVKNGSLHLGMKKKFWHKPIKRHGPINYRLEVIDLSKIVVSGSGDVTSKSINSNELSLRISGSGTIDIKDLEAEDLEVQISGSGECYLRGSAPEQSVHISGSGDYEAGKLEGDDVTVTVSGSGDATVWAREYLDVRVSGSGDVGYYGRPRITQRTSGSGDVYSRGSRQQ
jgi:hypothetical protein